MSGLMMRRHRCRGPVWCSKIRSRSKPRAQKALCCTLVFPIPSHDRCAIQLLALLRSDVLAAVGRLTPPQPELCKLRLSPSAPRQSAPSTARQHMHACVRGMFASATRTSIGGLRKIIPPSQVPDPAIGWTCRFIITLLAPIISNRRKDRSPIHCPAGHCGTQCPERVVVAPSLCLPPVEFCRGTRPSQAAKSRPLRNVSGGGARATRATRAVAINGPIPRCPAEVCKQTMSIRIGQAGYSSHFR